MNTPSQPMNRSRAIIVATLAAAGLAAVAVHASTASDTSPSAASAHSWHGHRHGPAGRFMHVLKQLNLSPEQETQIRSIFAASKSQFHELGASMRSNREALIAAAPTDAGYPALLATEKANAAKRIDQMSSIKTQIYAVLSAAQIKQIPQILAADKAKWQQRRQNSAPAATTSTPAATSS